MARKKGANDMAKKLFVEGVPDIDIRRGVAHFTFHDDEDVTVAMPLADFRACHAKARRIIAEYDAKSATVTPIKKQKT